MHSFQLLKEPVLTLEWNFLVEVNLLAKNQYYFL